MVIVEADDGLPAEVVGSWVKDKHSYLREYITYCRAVRNKFIGPGNAGATFFDPFCACGRAKINKPAEFVDGSPVVAWKASLDGNSPFSQVFIADKEDAYRQACRQRLVRLNCPVTELSGDAINAAEEFVKQANPYGLHFAFLDPHGLGALDFQIIRTLSSLRRIDLLVHISTMDLQRNVLSQVISKREQASLDRFAPGWRTAIELGRPAHVIRGQVLDHWKKLVAELGMQPFAQTPLIRGDRGQRLYWLLLAAKNEKAGDLWKAVCRAADQRTLDL